jgi:hypothetical protein
MRLEPNTLNNGSHFFSFGSRRRFIDILSGVMLINLMLLTARESRNITKKLLKRILIADCDLIIYPEKSFHDHKANE